MANAKAARAVAVVTLPSGLTCRMTLCHAVTGLAVGVGEEAVLVVDEEHAARDATASAAATRTDTTCRDRDVCMGVR